MRDIQTSHSEILIGDTMCGTCVCVSVASSIKIDLFRYTNGAEAKEIYILKDANFAEAEENQEDGREFADTNNREGSRWIPGGLCSVASLQPGTNPLFT